MVNGRVVYEQGHVVGIDEPALLAEAREVFMQKRPAIERARLAADRLRPGYQEMVRRAAAAEVGMTRWVGQR
jgi:hypothetical protein